MGQVFAQSRRSASLYKLETGSAGRDIIEMIPNWVPRIADKILYKGDDCGRYVALIVLSPSTFELDTKRQEENVVGSCLTEKIISLPGSSPRYSNPKDWCNVSGHISLFEMNKAALTHTEAILEMTFRDSRSD